ncbi:hypothetical protein LCGC14_2543630, partial [marine sediment metagenome]
RVSCSGSKRRQRESGGCRSGRAQSQAHAPALLQVVAAWAGRVKARFGLSSMARSKDTTGRAELSSFFQLFFKVIAPLYGGAGPDARWMGTRADVVRPSVAGEDTVGVGVRPWMVFPGRNRTFLGETVSRETVGPDTSRLGDSNGMVRPGGASRTFDIRVPTRAWPDSHQHDTKDHEHIQPQDVVSRIICYPIWSILVDCSPVPRRPGNCRPSARRRRRCGSW